MLVKFVFLLICFVGGTRVEATTLWQGTVVSGSVSSFKELPGKTHSSKTPVHLAVYLIDLLPGESIAVSAFAVNNDATKVALEVFDGSKNTRGAAIKSDSGGPEFPFDFPLALVRLTAPEKRTRYWVEIKAHAQQLGGYKIE